MKVFSQLISAQLENKSSDYTATVVGRIWWNTSTTRTMSADGTLVRALLRNDQFCIFGNSGTAANNIRLQRGANGVLQFVSGADTTAEGTLSTTLNQISARLENYTDAGKPATGNAGRLIYVTDLTTFKFDTGSTWLSFASGATTTRLAAMWDFVVGSAAQVTAGTATHSTIQAAINAAAAGNNILILQGTFTENPNVTVNGLNIYGHGFGTVISGTFTFNAVSNCKLTDVKVTGQITIDGASSGCIIDEIWQTGASPTTVSDLGTNDFVGTVIPV